ncbi:hypothetical protein [Mycobacteroides abscessus]|uniref:hypothetical protein n=1 Tax=Mycobacteroides abscessus TaxID=36809 RepID=UPI0019CFD451|nr:hypothetical protein [Mycobacteroides abscessus]MBN7457361.1 hypothetical protein [Mycobacteroides abscessus subsp. abscessus]
MTETVTALDMDGGGVWRVTTISGTVYTVDLDSKTLVREPVSGRSRTAEGFDGITHRVHEVVTPPRVGERFYAYVLWGGSYAESPQRVRTTPVVKIERAPR